MSVNPPAFPQSKWDNIDNNIVNIVDGGMSLLDYFAAVALHGAMYASSGGGLVYGADLPNDNERIARVAYAIANAMLKVSKERQS